MEQMHARNTYSSTRGARRRFLTTITSFKSALGRVLDRKPCSRGAKNRDTVTKV